MQGNFFSHITFWTKHSDMRFFSENRHLNHCYKKIGKKSVFFFNHLKGIIKVQQKNNITFNKTFLITHSTPINPPLTAQHKKRHLTQISQSVESCYAMCWHCSPITNAHLGQKLFVFFYYFIYCHLYRRKIRCMIIYLHWYNIVLSCNYVALVHWLEIISNVLSSTRYLSRFAHSQY